MNRLVVMGVSGCGKSTVGAALAQRLRLEMIDGDDLHAPASVAKMRAGVPLDDADRWPWLERIGVELTTSAAGRVIACSALRRSYRDCIRRHAPAVRFLFLDGPFELIAQRLSQRKDHYMPATLLESQFRTLERPGTGEDDVMTLGIGQPVEALVDAAQAGLLARGWAARQTGPVADDS